MKELKQPFKKDCHNLWYIDATDINLKPFKFNEITKSYDRRANFFKIDGISDYIIKDTTMYPLFFNRIRTIKFLENLQNKQDLFSDIDFSIGYCINKTKLKGTIIPYYDGSTSLMSFLYLKKLEDLEKLYYRDSSEIDNLVALFLDILDLLSKMYYENIIYLDIHSGNFLFYKNSIKIIDFEPGYVYFKDKNYMHYETLIKNYTMLVKTVCRKLGFKDILLNPGDTFMETENEVKVLRKWLER